MPVGGVNFTFFSDFKWVVREKAVYTWEKTVKIFSKINFSTATSHVK